MPLAHGYSVLLVCDEPDCGNNVESGRFMVPLTTRQDLEELTDLRIDAEREGWFHRDGKYLCPEHLGDPLH